MMILIYIKLVAVDSATTTVADITDAEGKLKTDYANETTEGGNLYYIAVAVDKDGKVLDRQGGTVAIGYGTTAEKTDKDASENDYEKTLSATVGQVFTVSTKDDYYAEGTEKFTVQITGIEENPIYEKPNVDSAPVTSTINDNPASDTLNLKTPVEQGGYDSTDTVYVKISENAKEYEGYKLSHTVSFVDKDGNAVTIPDGEEITVKLVYSKQTTELADFDSAKNQYQSEITVKINSATPKNSAGAYVINIDNETIEDFKAEETETYTLTITEVSQKNATFENVAIHSQNQVTGTILNGLVLLDPKNAKVDEDNFYTNDFDGTNGATSGKTALSATEQLITIPSGYLKGTDSLNVNFTNVVTASNGTSNNLPIRSNGKTVNVSVKNNVIKGISEDGREVYEITFNKADGKYTYKQYQNIDHPKEGDDSLTLSFNYKVVVNKNGKEFVSHPEKTFKVEVSDSVPVSETQTVIVNEDSEEFTFVVSDEGFNNETIQIYDVNGFVDITKNGTVDILDAEVKVGTLTNNGNGTLKFKPESNYSNYGSDNLPSFKYKISDNDGDTVENTINIKVKPVVDGTIFQTVTVNTTEDNNNTQEGSNSVALGWKLPEVKDNTDLTTSKNDHPERVGDFILKFGNGHLVSGAKLLGKDGNVLTTKDNTEIVINGQNQEVKVVIVNTDGTLNKNFHHSNVSLYEAKTIYLTKEQYEGIKISHAEDNDRDIIINVSTKTYEVDVDGIPLTSEVSNQGREVSNQGRFDSQNITVHINPVTDNIDLKWNNALDLGTISDDGKTFTFNNIKEGHKAIDLKALLSATSGAGTDTNPDLDGSEKRTYEIENLVEGTKVKLGSQTATAGKDGIATIEFNDANNKAEDPDFSIELPENFAGNLKDVTITLSVQDKGVDIADTVVEIKTTQVKFNIFVDPVADVATLRVGSIITTEDIGRVTLDGQVDPNDNPTNAIAGNGENGAELYIKVRSDDTDGSETFTVELKQLPKDGYIHYKGGLYGLKDDGTYGFIRGEKTENIEFSTEGKEIKDSETGEITVDNSIQMWKMVISDYDNNSMPKFIPPHNSDEDHIIKVKAFTVDSVVENGVVLKTHTQTEKIAESELSIVVKGVADVPVGNELNTFNKVGENVSDGIYAYREQENTLDGSSNKIALKSIYKALSNLDSFDNDGSEELSIIIEGKNLPEGFSIEGASPIEDGRWAFNLKSLDKDGTTVINNLDNIDIITPKNFSGEANFGLTYITTDKEGSTKTHIVQPVKIYVEAEVDSVMVSGTSGDEDSRFKVDFSLNKQGDDKEELKEVQIKVDEVTGKDFTLYLGEKEISNAELEIKDGYYVLTKEQANNIYAQNNVENKAGTYNFGIKYTVADGEVLKEATSSYELAINPVTDEPSFYNPTSSETYFKVIGTGATTFEVPIKVVSDDKDGSEKITKIEISGVPFGVNVEGITTDPVDSQNKTYTISGEKLNNFALNGSGNKLVFNVGADNNFMYRNIKITAYTQDGMAQEKIVSKDIILEREIPSNIIGTYPVIELQVKDGASLEMTEDTPFNFLDVFGIKTPQGYSDLVKYQINFSLDVKNATIEGLSPNEKGIYSLQGNKADIESVLSNIKVVPNQNFNDNQIDEKGKLELNVKVNNNTDLAPDIKVKPVTDTMIVTVGAASEINESTSLKFTVTLSNTADGKDTIIKDNVLNIKVVENFEAGETATGKLFYNGVEQTLTDGSYKIALPEGYQVGKTISGLEYKSATNRHGEVKIVASVSHKEAENFDNYSTLENNISSEIKVNVKPVVDSNIEKVYNLNATEDRTVKVHLSLEGEQSDYKGTKYDLAELINTDPSEKLVNVMLNDIPKESLVYYKVNEVDYKLAINLGADATSGKTKWMIPIIDGQMPGGVEIKTPKDYSGEFKFGVDFVIQDGDNASSKLETIHKDVTAKVTPVTDGFYYFNPTRAGIQSDGEIAKAFEWTNLNINTALADIDGSETLSLRFVGLDNTAQFRLTDGANSPQFKVSFEGDRNIWRLDNISAGDINKLQIAYGKDAKVEVEGYTIDQYTALDGTVVKDSNTINTGWKHVKNVATGKWEWQDTDDAYKAKYGAIEGEFSNRTTFKEFDLEINSNEISLGKEISIDFDKLNTATAFKDVSSIDLGKENGANSLSNLELADIKAMNESGKITIDGGSGDSVSFKSSVSVDESGNVLGKWTKDTSGADYDIYKNSSDSNVELKIAKGITTDINYETNIDIAGGANIDLSKISDIHANSINLKTQGASSINNITVDDVLKMTKGIDGISKLTITGDNQDSVNFKDTIKDDGTTQKWTKTAGTGDDAGFDIYTNDDPTVIVRVDQDIHDGITN